MLKYIIIANGIKPSKNNRVHLVIAEYKGSLLIDEIFREKLPLLFRMTYASKNLGRLTIREKSKTGPTIRQTLLRIKVG